MRPLNHLRFYDTDEFNGTSAVPNLQNHQLKPNRTKPKQLKVFGGTEIHTINNFISLTLSSCILNKIGFLYRCISCPICWVLTWSKRIYASPGSLWTSNASWDYRGSAGATVPGLHPNSFPLCLGKLLIIQTASSSMEQNWKWQYFPLKRLLVAASRHSLYRVLFPMPSA